LIDPSILKTERPPVTCARSKSYCGKRNRPTAPPAPPAEAGSFIGTFRTSRNVRLESVMRTNADVRQDAAMKGCGGKKLTRPHAPFCFTFVIVTGAKHAAAY
jgi:hypothetical protein